MKHKQFVLSTPVYPYSLGVWIGEWREAPFLRFVKRIGLWNGKGAPPSDPETDAAFFSFGSGGCVFLRWPITDPAAHGSMAHELMHASAHMGSVLGFELSSDSDEFYAYMVGYWTREILKRAGARKRR